MPRSSWTMWVKLPSRHNHAMRIPAAACITLAALLAAAAAHAHDNHVQVTVEGDQRCITSNGLPDHDTGSFPNRGNPHRIQEQNIRLCVPLNPVKGTTPNRSRGSVGVAINGVQFRPGTADYYDPSSPRGHSRDLSSGWNLEGLGARDALGMDRNNAHVDERGLYHYHGVPEPLVGDASRTPIGWAADGFEIHYVGHGQTSSWQLKPGTRPTAPGGRYDGTYEEDWVLCPAPARWTSATAARWTGVSFITRPTPFRSSRAVSGARSAQTSASGAARRPEWMGAWVPEGGWDRLRKAGAVKTFRRAGIPRPRGSS